MSTFVVDPEIFEKVKSIKPIEVPSKEAISNEMGLLLSYLTYISSGSVLEIGCGKSTGYIFPFLKENQSFYCIDIDMEKIKQVFSIFEKNCSNRNNVATEFSCIDSRVYNMPFNEYGKLGLVFIDGNHSLSGIINDITKSLPFLHIGGYIVAHDFLSGVNTITPSVDLFCNFIHKHPNEFGLKSFTKIQNFVDYPGSMPIVYNLCKGCTRKNELKLTNLVQIFLAQKVTEQFIIYKRE